ncbi:MAG: lysophospholipid acyltransferase family protein [Gammaproteobacteria bacterium]|nr:lysophospholipid acyltransferase family protein [Gammaproteobacteria bacterium]
MSRRAGRTRQAATRTGLAALRAASQLPLPLLALIGRLMGVAAYYLMRTRRHVVQVNLRLCFPQWSQKARTRLAKAHFRALGQGIFDLPVAWWASPRRLRRLVQFVDRHHFDEAAAAGRVILLTPHFVPLKIGVALSLERPMANVYRRMPNPVVEEAFRAAIGRFGATMIAQEEGIKPILRALREGRVLYYLPDQDFGERGSVFAPFFGVPTSTLEAAGRLARTVGARVVPCYVWQRPWGRGYQIAFGPALPGFPSGDRLADATATNAAIEAGVRIHPEQYFWVHKRFKTRPPGSEPVY